MFFTETIQQTILSEPWKIKQTKKNSLKNAALATKEMPLANSSDSLMFERQDKHGVEIETTG